MRKEIPHTIYYQILPHIIYFSTKSSFKNDFLNYKFWEKHGASDLQNVCSNAACTHIHAIGSEVSRFAMLWEEQRTVYSFC